MEFLFFVILILISAGAVLFLILEIFAVFVGEWYGAPFVRSQKSKIKLMLELANIQPGERVYDLGSGDGTLVTKAAYLGAKAVGIEINPFLVIFSRWRIRLAGLENRASIIKKDFRKHNLADADVVFFYLWPKTIGSLEEKLLQELKPGTRVISNGFPISTWTPIIEKDNVYLYEK